MTEYPIVQITDLVTGFGDTLIHDHLNLEITRGQVLGLVGASGAGKSVLLKTMIMLLPSRSGSIRLFGQDIALASVAEAKSLKRRFGMMFQNGALFNSLSVLENIIIPLREHTDLSEALMRELGMLKLKLVGLPASSAAKFPGELSGGMIKRAAVARALALDPELLFLDEPTAGLDPVASAALDDLVLALRHELDLTIVMVTHDLDSLWRATERVAFIGRKRILASAPIDELAHNDLPEIVEFFGGERAKRFVVN